MLKKLLWLLAGGPPLQEPPPIDPDATTMRLIIGLGNFEAKYLGTRHNVGFEVVDRLAELWGTSFVASKLLSLVATTRQRDEQVILAKPTTYMNLSGNAARALKDFYKADLANVLVICDDFNIDLGTLRMREKGSDGGQKGLRHIVQLMGTQQVPRLRLGIGPLPQNANVSHYVLSRFNQQERETATHMVDRATDAVEAWMKFGMDRAQQRYNGPLPETD